MSGWPADSLKSKEANQCGQWLIVCFPAVQEACCQLKTLMCCKKCPQDSNRIVTPIWKSSSTPCFCAGSHVAVFVVDNGRMSRWTPKTPCIDERAYERGNYRQKSGRFKEERYEHAWWHERLRCRPNPGGRKVFWRFVSFSFSLTSAEMTRSCRDLSALWFAQAQSLAEEDTQTGSAGRAWSSLNRS